MVSEIGIKILSGLDEARSFFSQVSLLIRTGDDMLGEAGWECFSTNKCADLTGSIHRPNKWIPQTIYRLYQLPGGENAEAENDTILFLGVLLDRKGAWSGFQEPWLTFGLYQFLPGQNTHGFPPESWVEEPLNEGYDPDGSFTPWENPGNDPLENEGVLYQEVAAVPLITIQGSEDLKRVVIEPLLAKVQVRLAG